MSAVAFGRLAVFGQKDSEPPAQVLWIAIFLSVIIFGLGHLPAAAATISLSPGVIAYIIVGNAVGGIIFGWLFWRWSPEAAMFTHMPPAGRSRGSGRRGCLQRVRGRSPARWTTVGEPPRKGTDGADRSR